MENNGYLGILLGVFVVRLCAARASTSITQNVEVTLSDFDSVRLRLGGDTIDRVIHTRVVLVGAFSSDVQV